MIPRELPVVNLGGEAYFLDIRLSQLRKVSGPHDFIDLSASERRDFLKALLVREAARRYSDRPTDEWDVALSAEDQGSNDK
jgi:hypothetical protein